MLSLEALRIDTRCLPLQKEIGFAREMGFEQSEEVFSGTIVVFEDDIEGNLGQ